MRICGESARKRERKSEKASEKASGLQKYLM
jgi:hypothetical protein